MKKALSVISIIALIVIAICGTSWLIDNHQFNQWTVQSSSTIPWAKFIWAKDSLANQYRERTAMLIPAKIKGLSNNLLFQFDLGSNLTMIYERNANSVLGNYPGLTNPITKLKSSLQFWDRHKSYKNISIRLGDITIQTPDCFVMEGYGDDLQVHDTLTPIPIGTLGADVFRNKVLIVDYPHQQFAICNSVPLQYDIPLTDIDLDNFGRVVLPMVIHGHKLRILFDNGSSIFPLITMDRNIGKFATGPDTDTLTISSWQQSHQVTGKMISDTLMLAGHKFSHVKVYSNHRGLGIDKNTDGMAGNALFWDKIIIIDFKHKKFGLK